MMDAVETVLAATEDSPQSNVAPNVTNGIRAQPSSKETDVDNEPETMVGAAGNSATVNVQPPSGHEEQETMPELLVRKGIDDDQQQRGPEYKSIVTEAAPAQQEQRDFGPAQPATEDPKESETIDRSSIIQEAGQSHPVGELKEPDLDPAADAAETKPETIESSAVMVESEQSHPVAELKGPDPDPAIIEPSAVMSESEQSHPVAELKGPDPEPAAETTPEIIEPSAVMSETEESHPFAELKGPDPEPAADTKPEIIEPSAVMLESEQSHPIAELKGPDPKPASETTPDIIEPSVESEESRPVAELKGPDPEPSAETKPEITEPSAVMSESESHPVAELKGADPEPSAETKPEIFEPSVESKESRPVAELKGPDPEPSAETKPEIIEPPAVMSESEQSHPVAELKGPDPEPSAETKPEIIEPPAVMSESEQSHPVAELKGADPEPAAETKPEIIEPSAESEQSHPVAELKGPDPEPAAETKPVIIEPSVLNSNPCGELKGPEPMAAVESTETNRATIEPSSPMSEPEQCHPVGELKGPEPEPTFEAAKTEPATIQHSAIMSESEHYHPVGELNGPEPELAPETAETKPFDLGPDTKLGPLDTGNADEANLNKRPDTEPSGEQAPGTTDPSATTVQKRRPDLKHPEESIETPSEPPEDEPKSCPDPIDFAEREAEQEANPTVVREPFQSREPVEVMIPPEPEAAESNEIKGDDELVTLEMVKQEGKVADETKPGIHPDADGASVTVSPPTTDELHVDPDISTSASRTKLNAASVFGGGLTNASKRDDAPRVKNCSTEGPAVGKKKLAIPAAFTAVSSTPTVTQSEPTGESKQNVKSRAYTVRPVNDVTQGSRQASQKIPETGVPEENFPLKNKKLAIATAFVAGSADDNPPSRDEAQTQSYGTADTHSTEGFSTTKKRLVIPAVFAGGAGSVESLGPKETPYEQTLKAPRKKSVLIPAAFAGGMSEVDAKQSELSKPIDEFNTDNGKFVVPTASAGGAPRPEMGRVPTKPQATSPQKDVSPPQKLSVPAAFSSGSPHKKADETLLSTAQKPVPSSAQNQKMIAKQQLLEEMQRVELEMEEAQRKLMAASSMGQTATQVNEDKATLLASTAPPDAASINGGLPEVEPLIVEKDVVNENKIKRLDAAAQDENLDEPTAKAVHPVTKHEENLDEPTAEAVHPVVKQEAKDMDESSVNNHVDTGSSSEILLSLKAAGEPHGASEQTFPSQDPSVISNVDEALNSEIPTPSNAAGDSLVPVNKTLSNEILLSSESQDGFRASEQAFASQDPPPVKENADKVIDNGHDPRPDEENVDKAIDNETPFSSKDPSPAEEHVDKTKNSETPLSSEALADDKPENNEPPLLREALGDLHAPSIAAESELANHVGDPVGTDSQLHNVQFIASKTGQTGQVDYDADDVPFDENGETSKPSPIKYSAEGEAAPTSQENETQINESSWIAPVASRGGIQPLASMKPSDVEATKAAEHIGLTPPATPSPVSSPAKGDQNSPVNVEASAQAEASSNCGCLIL